MTERQPFTPDDPATQAMEHLRKIAPIVTQDGFEAIEDELIRRWNKSKDPFTLTVVSALRSLMREVERYEHVWSVANEVAVRRLQTENAILRRALEIATDAEPESP